MKAAAPRDKSVRVNGNANLLAAARAAVAGDMYCNRPRSGTPPVADESTTFAFEALPGIAAGCRTYADLEATVIPGQEIQGVMLRYGFFYGPGRWFTKDGDVGDQVRRQQVSIIGKGQGVWSWVQIEDAAWATARALDPPGCLQHRRRPAIGTAHLAARFRAFCASSRAAHHL